MWVLKLADWGSFGDGFIWNHSACNCEYDWSYGIVEYFNFK